MIRAGVSGLIVAMLVALPVKADFLTSKSKAGVFRSQTSVIDKRKRAETKSAVRIEPRPVYTPSKWGDGSYQGKYNGPYLALAQDAATRHGVPVDLFLKLVQQESGWNATAQSHKGALGLAQLMPGTARRLGVDPLDPAQNLDGGARYLAQQYRSFGSWRLALAAYNAGPEAVRRHGGVPPYQETRNYVRVIWGS
ncbi:MAG: lytic transglycosylase domain-containing protein [Rhodobacteraceae bacterium]|nr:lytic transglycosylase domain-containing protein [Paracoccaceae bacterium]MCW9044111.1 lytic transglycosylase domain-containing protein [Pseudopelagicola sp.]